jgi:hypothetical protein
LPGSFPGNRNIYMRRCGKIIRAGQVTYEDMEHGTACRLIKATNTHTEYVLLTAFARQKLLHERASMLR